MDHQSQLPKTNDKNKIINCQSTEMIITSIIIVFIFRFKSALIMNEFF